MSFKVEGKFEEMKHFDMIISMLENGKRSKINVFLDTKTKTFYTQLKQFSTTYDWFAAKDPGFFKINLSNILSSGDTKEIVTTKFLKMIQDTISSLNEKDIVVARKIGDFPRHDSIDSVIEIQQKADFLSEMEWVTETATYVKIRFENKVKVFKNDTGLILGYLSVDKKMIEQLDAGSCPVKERWKTPDGRCGISGWGNAKYLKDNLKIYELKDRYNQSNSIVTLITNPEDELQKTLLIFEDTGKVSQNNFSYFCPIYLLENKTIEHFVELLFAGSCPIKDGWAFKYENVLSSHYLED